VKFRVDQSGNRPCDMGRWQFDANELAENAHAIIQCVIKAQPRQQEGAIVKRNHPDADNWARELHRSGGIGNFWRRLLSFAALTSNIQRIASKSMRSVAKLTAAARIPFRQIEV